MTNRPSDLAPHHGVLRRLHLFAGNALATASNLLRPRLSLGARLVALDDQGRVFLVKHSYVPGFYLPGGAVELDETVADAALREAHEEGGLEFPNLPVLFNIYRSTKAGRRDHIVLFVVRDATRSPTAKSSFPEIIDAGFYPADDLPPDTTDATRRRIAEVLDGTEVTGIW